MPTASTKELVTAAAEAKTGIGAFNVIHLETAEALVRAAEEAQLPVILQISQNCVKYHGALEPIAATTLELARASSAQVAVHLDHCEKVDLAKRAVDLGFNSVMFDGSWTPYEENVSMTAEVVDYAHAHNCDVEAELGEIGGKQNAHAPGVRTNPNEAASFVASTGVDLLAVAVGSQHAMASRTASLDLDLIAEIKDALDVPLVLHGSSGVPDDEILRGIRAGMTKINVSTHLNGFFTRAIREFLTDNPEVTDSRKYVAKGREALGAEASRLLTLFATEA
ncbi:fructose-bisphosphate aldolase [Corynebacterium yudongzhengii]|uniref:Class II fructose-bisphosphate aldolase n=1 Tax=Corynebacterium yudongzhengii TaxID=2080740 RepID=A0A2U1T900_9CORY|nr:class II fructose-bisphosphate aldolase [Corynebacterium yudongzhengii]AWB82482.1 fructose-bisphosphate aldolase [Corynebacterium yudongzhengii]PWC02462.1 class II fructose-bisphosphate aldolase [Corynebacterium yudongzhengii]